MAAKDSFGLTPQMLSGIEAELNRLVPAGGVPEEAVNREKQGGLKVAHSPTPETRMIVRVGVFAGVTHESLARLLGVSTKTLLKHYEDELATAHAAFSIKITAAQLQIAMDVKNARSVSAAQFLMRTRGGEAWRDHDEVPPPVDIKFSINIGERGNAG